MELKTIIETPFFEWNDIWRLYIYRNSIESNQEEEIITIKRKKNKEKKKWTSRASLDFLALSLTPRDQDRSIFIGSNETNRSIVHPPSFILSTHTHTERRYMSRKRTRSSLLLRATVSSAFHVFSPLTCRDIMRAFPRFLARLFKILFLFFLANINSIDRFFPFYKSNLFASKRIKCLRKIKLTGDWSFDIDHSLLGAEEGGSIGDYAKSRRLVDPTFEDKVLLEDFRPRPVCPRVEHLGHCKFVRRRKEHICEQSTTTISDNNCSNNECFHWSFMKNLEDLYFYAITYHGKGEDKFCLIIL